MHPVVITRCIYFYSTIRSCFTKQPGIVYFRSKHSDRFLHAPPVVAFICQRKACNTFRESQILYYISTGTAYDVSKQQPILLASGIPLQQTRENMKRIEIIVDSDSIYKRLFKESGYAVRSRSAMGMNATLADTVHITDDERETLGQWVRKSINEAVHGIYRYVGPCSVKYCMDTETGGERYVISVTAPHNYPTEHVALLETCISDLVFNRTMQQWYTTMKPDEASLMAANIQEDALLFRELLTQRERPVKNDAKQENIIEL